MIPARGFQSRRAGGQEPLFSGGDDGEPPESGRPPGRLPPETRAEAIARWRHGLADGTTSPRAVILALHGLPWATPERIAEALRAVNWPQGAAS